MMNGRKAEQWRKNEQSLGNNTPRIMQCSTGAVSSLWHRRRRCLLPLRRLLGLLLLLGCPLVVLVHFVKTARLQDKQARSNSAAGKEKVSRTAHLSAQQLRHTRQASYLAHTAKMHAQLKGVFMSSRGTQKQLLADPLHCTWLRLMRWCRPPSES
jgi:hypothetical protein